MSTAMFPAPQPMADLALIGKYNQPGPRYTSYPPANYFKDGAEAGLSARALAEEGQPGGDLSLYFHLPFCRSLCWYCACNTIITTQQEQSSRYIEYLDREMALSARTINPERKAGQLHFGGGTPTFLLPDEIRRLGERIQAHFPYAKDIEASVEIDPRRLTAGHVAALKESGFNRASMGIQDVNPAVQAAIHRIQPLEQTQQAFDWLRGAGFESINVDLIYGLPHQTVDSFRATLESIVRLAPDRLAVFNYAHVPWLKPAQKNLLDAAMPQPETKLAILNLTIEMLGAHGYSYIGMDHFARENDELAIAQREGTMQRNFQGYSTRGGADTYAFGLSAISQVGRAYWQNEKTLDTYYGALDAGRLPIAKGYYLSEAESIRRQTIMRLMCDMRLDFANMSESLGLDFEDYFSAELNSLSDMEADGLLTKTDTGLETTPLGRLLIRNIAMRFDASLPSVQERRSSKTI